MKKIVLLTLVVLGMGFKGGSLYAAGDLDGTQWKMHEGKHSIGKGDTLKFENGNFTSMECIPYGFNSGPYESKKEGEQSKWNATQKNSKGETMVWEGMIQPNGKMKGTYIYTNEKGKVSKKSWNAQKAS